MASSSGRSAPASVSKASSVDIWLFFLYFFRCVMDVCFFHIRCDAASGQMRGVLWIYCLVYEKCYINKVALPYYVRQEMRSSQRRVQENQKNNLR